MNRTQQYLVALLDRLPRAELVNDDQRALLEQIRQKLEGAEDMDRELQRLFRVQGCGDFALSLMWIAGKVENDPSLLESNADEEAFVFSKFQKVFGEIAPRAAEISAGLPAEFPETIFPPVQPVAPAAAEEPVVAVPPPNEVGDSGEEERHLALLMDRFLEAVQNGSEERTRLLTELQAQCDTVAGLPDAPEDLRRYVQMLMDFLQYISANQLLEDVRVMNMVSNVQDPLSQWVRTSPDDRAGLLDPAFEMLHDFRTMFE